MSTDIIPFGSKNLPAHVNVEKAKAINSDLTGHGGIGFPIMSIKGKVFTLRENGVDEILKDPENKKYNAQAISVILAKVSPNKSKTYYEGGYTPNSDAKPTCTSIDGKKPDPGVEKPQSNLCATCPKNVVGAKIGDNGKKMKACADSVRAAIVTTAEPDKAIMLRIPPASIGNLTKFGQKCTQHGVTYQQVLTEIQMDQEAETPKLDFVPLGMLPDAVYEQVVKTANSETVQFMLGTSEFVGDAEPAQPSVEEQTNDVITKAKETAAKVAAPVKKVSQKEVEQVVAVAEGKPVEEAPKKSGREIQFDDVDFDD